MGLVDGTLEDGTDTKGFGFILQSVVNPTQSLHYSTDDVKELLEIHSIIGKAIADLMAQKAN